MLSTYVFAFTFELITVKECHLQQNQSKLYTYLAVVNAYIFLSTDVLAVRFQALLQLGHTLCADKI